MPTSKNVKLEFVSDEQRLASINARLQSVENEVMNAQLDLAVEQAIQEKVPQAGVPGVAHTFGLAGVEQRQAALDAALTRLEALRALRDSMTGTAKD